MMQNIVDFGTTSQKINLAKSVFDPPSVSNFFWECARNVILLYLFMIPDFKSNWKFGNLFTCCLWCLKIYVCACLFGKVNFVLLS